MRREQIKGCKEDMKEAYTEAIRYKSKRIELLSRKGLWVEKGGREGGNEKGREGVIIK